MSTAHMNTQLRDALFRAFAKQPIKQSKQSKQSPRKPRTFQHSKSTQGE